MKCAHSDQQPQDVASREMLHEVIRVLQATMDMDISAFDESFLHKSITKRTLVCGLNSTADYAAHLEHQRTEAEAFYHSLHISYSEFFRNPLTFAVLEQQILPSLIASKKHAGENEIRVWSAACAAGQEAWSIAMLLDELTEAQHPPLTYRIFASDLSKSELALARAGVYSAKAVGNVRLRHLNEYFSRQDESFVIASRLRERVDFSTYDLLDDASSSPESSIYGDFDLILVCNLLFYYRPDRQQRVLDKVCGTLAPSGYFLTGEAERDIIIKHNCLHSVALQSPIFQMKSPLK